MARGIEVVEEGAGMGMWGDIAGMAEQKWGSPNSGDGNAWHGTMHAINRL